MQPEVALTRARLTTPRAAAVAGILFSVLLSASLVLIRLSIPADSHDAGTWLSTSGRSVHLGLNLVPFAGIAFLWFIGVVRDRLGEYEDRFFATVFLGSGLLFLAMLFVSAALTGAMIVAYEDDPTFMANASTYALGRAATYAILNTYAIRMAGVFMISTCTVFARTKVMPRWITFLGYALALVLLLVVSQFAWVIEVFPAWIFLISVQILSENFRKRSDAAAAGSA